MKAQIDKPVLAGELRFHACQLHGMASGFSFVDFAARRRGAVATWCIDTQRGKDNSKRCERAANC